jgi:hypothetical protein
MCRCSGAMQRLMDNHCSTAQLLLTMFGMGHSQHSSTPREQAENTRTQGRVTQTVPQRQTVVSYVVSAGTVFSRCRLRDAVCANVDTAFMKTTFGRLPCRMPVQQDSRAGTAESASHQVNGSVGMQNKANACTESHLMCLHSQDQGPFPQHAQHCHLLTMNGRLAQPLPPVLPRLDVVIVEFVVGGSKQQTAQSAYLALLPTVTVATSCLCQPLCCVVKSRCLRLRSVCFWPAHALLRLGSTTLLSGPTPPCAACLLLQLTVTSTDNTSLDVNQK